MAMDTDCSQPHLQYSTVYESRWINGTKVKVRAGEGMGGGRGASLGPLLRVVHFAPTPAFVCPLSSDIWWYLFYTLQPLPRFCLFWYLRLAPSSPFLVWASLLPESHPALG